MPVLTTPLPQMTATSDAWSNEVLVAVGNGFAEPQGKKPSGSRVAVTPV